MNTIRLFLAIALGIIATFVFLSWVEDASAFAASHGYAGRYGIVGLGALVALCVAFVASFLIPTRQEPVEITSEGLVVTPTNGRLVMRPGENVTVFADHPRDARGRYVKLP